MPGVPGMPGPQGPQGREGTKGKTGAKGTKGMMGPKGERGREGIHGKSGPPGMKGEPGSVRAAGRKGDKGEKGESVKGSSAGPVPQTNWKQCVWRTMDITNSGKIKVENLHLSQESYREIKTSVLYGYEEMILVTVMTNKNVNLL